ncbi:hypothetical protein BGX38DRAFT_1146345 [Terfezia claveryi]|nr:hypothetical protein BGX38DRAFT_1146345 [Terfezia claveryi]
MPWTKPKASSGKKVPRAVLAETMGIELDSYNQILEVARGIIATTSTPVLQTKRWNLVPTNVKSSYRVELRAEVQSRLGSTEFAELQRIRAVEILQDDNIADHFMLSAYQTLRNSSRLRDLNKNDADTAN